MAACVYEELLVYSMAEAALPCVTTAFRTVMVIGLLQTLIAPVVCD